MKQTVVYIAGPLSSSGDRLANVKRAAEVAYELTELGYATICPHLTHYVDPLDKLGLERWYRVSETLVEHADIVLRLPGASTGADREVARAMASGISVCSSIEELRKTLAPEHIIVELPSTDGKILSDDELEDLAGTDDVLERLELLGVDLGNLDRFPEAAMQRLIALMANELFWVHADGHAEYAHDDANTLENFSDAARDLDLEPMQVLWVLAKKHIRGILAYIKGHRSQRENVRGRIKDLMAYLCLLRAMVELEDAKAAVAEEQSTLTSAA